MARPAMALEQGDRGTLAVTFEAEAAEARTEDQLDMFSGPADERDERREREKRMQLALLDIRDKYGKNAIVKGLNLKEGATAMERNKQIGGHKA